MIDPIYTYILVAIAFLCFYYGLYLTIKLTKHKDDKREADKLSLIPLSKETKWRIINHVRQEYGYEMNDPINQKLLRQTYYDTDQFMIAAIEYYNVFYLGER